MSEKPISSEAIPKFEDTFNLSRDFNAAVYRFTLIGSVFCASIVRCVYGVRPRRDIIIARVATCKFMGFPI